jgi:Ca2+-binding RTX toxin-like protein
MSDFIEVGTTQRKLMPYAQIGTLVTTYSNGHQTVGTFSVVGRNDILTATHCVYNPDRGGLAAKLDFYLGADFNNMTDRFEDEGNHFSVVPSSSNALYFRATFQDSDNTTLTLSESQYDIALIGLDYAIGDTTGYLTLNPLINKAGEGQAVGYPSDSTGMMSKDISFFPYNSSYYLYNVIRSLDLLKPGNSGGPLLVENYVIGVASAGNDYGSTWSPIKQNFSALTAFMKTNDSLMGGTSHDLIFDYSGYDIQNYDHSYIYLAGSSRYTLNATSANEKIKGNDSDNSVAGNGGKDYIDGGNGNDVLSGGDGNDEISGGAGKNILIGDAGDDYLDSSLGSDTVYGGLGNDIFYVGASLDDNLIELPNEGDDTFMVDFSYAMSDTKNRNIENLWGVSENKLVLTGNVFGNKILGSFGDDTLNGKLGSDTLTGLYGKDTFVFNTKLSVTNIDTITDFTSGTDKIALDDAIFTKFKNDKNLKDNFKVGGAASTPKDYVIYDNTTGYLYYDSDGSGKKLPVQIAVIGLQTHPTILDVDFLII